VKERFLFRGYKRQVFPETCCRLDVHLFVSLLLLFDWLCSSESFRLSFLIYVEFSPIEDLEMRGLDRWIADVIISESLDLDAQNQILGGLFLDESLPSSSVSFVSSKSCSVSSCRFVRKSSALKLRRRNRNRGPLFSSVSLSINESNG